MVRAYTLHMKFLHYDLDLNSNDVVEVTLDRQANVRLLDPINFGRFRRGERHSCRGGLAKTSPVRLSAPHRGTWRVVVDLGGFAGRVSASVRVLR